MGTKKTRRKSVKFRSDDGLLEAARGMFRARTDLADLRKSGKPKKAVAEARREERERTRAWHQAFDATDDEVVLRRCARENRLNRTEREILAALALNQLGLLNEELGSVQAVLGLLAVRDRAILPALRLLSEDGRLYKRKLIFYADEEVELKDRAVLADPNLVEGILYRRERGALAWRVKSEEELRDKLGSLTRAFMKKSEAVEALENGWGDAATHFKSSRALQRLLDGLFETLRSRPAWRLSRLLLGDRAFKDAQRRVLLVLYGKELGHVEADDDLFQGIGIARAVSASLDQVRRHLRLLAAGGTLAQGGWIRPCAGADAFLGSDPGSLAGVEFELTEQALEALGAAKTQVRRRGGKSRVRPARVRLESLVLSAKVREALAMAHAQAKHGRTLLDTWGLGKAIPYGRGVTLLFSGPPGVGKTACAEGLARSLGKPILVADYAEIQNCFVGNTEKNIVRTFREAQAHGAVLFWDEADAMFFDRETGTRSWEVRDVNVLLQELERFEGVCVLATNRTLALDRALERRIAVKVRFEAPDRTMRLKIWKRLVPRSLPVEKGLDFRRLSETELTGGGIKNAVLNAARRALARDPSGPVTFADFRKAVEAERESAWTGGGTGRIGFVR